MFDYTLAPNPKFNLTTELKNQKGADIGVLVTEAIKGIAGNAIQSIKALELSREDEQGKLDFE